METKMIEIVAAVTISIWCGMLLTAAVYGMLNPL